MLTRINNLFPVWAIILSLAAYWAPTFFAEFKTSIIPLLSMIMFFMGLTLTTVDFKRTLRTPKPIVIGILLQFTLMPAVAFGIGWWLELPQDITAGLILVGCCGGGTASNVICYLARANVALSITMTLCSTLIGVILTPLLCWLYIAATIELDQVSILFSIIKMVLLPVLAGVIIKHFFSDSIKKIEVYLPTASIVAIIFIIAIIVALNQSQLTQIGLLTLVAVALHNGLGMLGGYIGSRLMGLPEADCRTIAIEVGMQNSGLGVALALKYISPIAALPGTIFSIWHNIVGSLLASYWSKTSDINNN
jgi:BASS family bile acid:Na+ symporter